MEGGGGLVCLQEGGVRGFWDLNALRLDSLGEFGPQTLLVESVEPQGKNLT